MLDPEAVLHWKRRRLEQRSLLGGGRRRGHGWVVGRRDRVVNLGVELGQVLAVRDADIGGRVEGDDA